jgi:hypothetical protein
MPSSSSCAAAATPLISLLLSLSLAVSVAVSHAVSHADASSSSSSSSSSFSSLLHPGSRLRLLSLGGVGLGRPLHELQRERRTTKTTRKIATTATATARGALSSSDERPMMGSCSYPNAFSGGTTCVQYHGSAWTQDDMTAMCDGEGGASSPDACPAGDDDVDLVAAFAHSIAHGLPAPKPGISLSSSHHGRTNLRLVWASYTSGSRNKE